MELGRHFDPYSYAESKGITVALAQNVQDGCMWHLPTRTVQIDDKLDPTDARCATTYALAWALMPNPTPKRALQWAAARLVPPNDLDALAGATPDRRLWARALNVSVAFITAFLGSVALEAAA